MEDVMEFCWLNVTTMCPHGFKCETCPREIEYKKSIAAKESENLKENN